MIEIESFEPTLMIYQNTLDAPQQDQGKLEQTISQLKTTIAYQEQLIMDLQADKVQLQAENDAIMNQHKQFEIMSEVLKAQMNQIAELKKIILIQQKVLRQQNGDAAQQ